MKTTAFKEADKNMLYYICDTQCQPMLEVGKPSAKIANLLKSFDNKGGVFISAWNPSGQTQSAQNNARASERLQADLQALKLNIFEGFSANQKGKCREDSCFAWPISEKQALLLGKRYHQKTVLFVNEKGTAKLLHIKP